MGRKVSPPSPPPDYSHIEIGPFGRNRASKLLRDYPVTNCVVLGGRHDVNGIADALRREYRRNHRRSRKSEIEKFVEMVITALQAKTPGPVDCGSSFLHRLR
jgi:hypothetical protein